MFVHVCVCVFLTNLNHIWQAETENKFAETTLYSLESTISERKAELELPQNGKPSWTKRLLLNSNLLCSKIRYIQIGLSLLQQLRNTKQTNLLNVERIKLYPAHAKLLHSSLFQGRGR